MIKLNLKNIVITTNIIMLGGQLTLSCIRAGDINKVQSLEQQLILLKSQNFQFSDEISSLSSIPSIVKRAAEKQFIVIKPTFLTSSPVASALNSKSISP